MKINFLWIYNKGVSFLENHPSLQRIHNHISKAIISWCRKNNFVKFEHPSYLTNNHIKAISAIWYCMSAMIAIMGLCLVEFKPIGVFVSFSCVIFCICFILYAVGVINSESLNVPPSATSEVPKLSALAQQDPRKRLSMEEAKILLFEGKSEKEKESVIIALIWMIPVLICLGGGKYGQNTLIDDIPELIPFFALWMFFGWSFPALYFKWKHRKDKPKNLQNNSLIEQPTKRRFYQKKTFFWGIIILALLPIFTIVRDILFIYGISTNDTGLVKDMVVMGSNVNKLYEDTSPLMGAIQNQNIKMVSILIEAGANVSLKNSKGETALSIAQKIGNKNIISILKLDDT